MKFLKTYWAALILTGAATAAYISVGQTALTSGLLVLAAAAWIGIGYWISSAPEKSVGVESALNPAEVRQSIVSIVDRINQFIDEEVGILNGSLEQIQSLAKDAVGSLGKSMHSLNHQVQRQSKLLDNLAGITGRAEEQEGQDALSIGKFVDDSESVIQYFMRLLNELGEQRDGYAKGLRQMKEQIVQLREATAQYTGDNARDIRSRLLAVRTLTDREAERVGDSKTWTDEHNNANKAVRQMQSSKEKLQGMRDVVAMSVAAFSTQSSKDVDEAIRSLQFEDIVSQLVAGAQGRLDEVNQLVSTLNSRVDRLKVIDAESEPLGALEIVENISSDVVEYTERLRASRHQPVGQSSLDEGSVELF